MILLGPREGVTPVMANDGGDSVRGASVSNAMPAGTAGAGAARPA